MKLTKNIILELNNNKNLVFHGSSNKFNILKPSFTSRIKKDGTIIYQGTSLHVSDHIGKALSYSTLKDGINYTTGTDLYKNNNKIYFYGPKDLEDALNNLLKDKTYLYVFYRQNFIHKSQKKQLQGLGEYELISYNEQIPIAIYEINKSKHFIELAKTIGYNIVFNVD